VLDNCRLIDGAPLDGDSFRVAHEGREYAFRLYFVDAPEAEELFRDRVDDQAAYFGIPSSEIQRAGELAAAFTRAKLSGRDFSVITRWQNALGRGKLARFYCEALVGGKNLGEELVANGLARVYGLKAVRPGGTRASNVIMALKNLELTAREQKRGIWDEARFPRGATQPTTPPVSASGAPGNELIDLNTASYEALQKLPGIGPKLAERIIAHRPYKSVDELARVSGISSGRLERLTPLVRVSPPAN
jgi:DNA uptake protein ComE-like DNA-binding protein